MMTRKDSEKEADRPHYYSQFWLDVAAGRHVIGAPKPGEESEIAEPEPEPIAPRRMTRPGSANDHATSDGRRETPVHVVARPVALPDVEPDEIDEPEDDEITENAPSADEVSPQDFDVTDDDLPDMELDEDAEDNEDEDEEDFDEDEDEEEDEDWGARGRKKPKPARPVKPPVNKKVKRDRRY